MRIKPYVEHEVPYIEGLCQEIDRTAATWIVEKVSHDTGNNSLWVTGHHLDGEPFFWNLHRGRPLSARYDFTNAKLTKGCHQWPEDSQS